MVPTVIVILINFYLIIKTGNIKFRLVMFVLLILSIVLSIILTRVWRDNRLMKSEHGVRKYEQQ